MTSFAPGSEVGGYRLDRLVGEGATGVVYAASAAEGSEVAVKLLRADDEIVRARFEREARLAASVESRHVVAILELGTADGVSYLVMPFYAGGTLRDRLRREGTLELDETARLAAELGRGLDALHGVGVLHRDVKPSNVLLAADGSAALADFGLARAPDSTRLTREGQLLGTPLYMAPEVIAGTEAGRPADVYALACVLYECLTGAPPFTAGGPAELAFAHLAEEPADPRGRRPELTADAALALLTALSKNPADRPSTATALARMFHLSRRSAPA